MALTKVGSGGIENVTNAANATFLTIDASEQITVASEGGAVTTSVQQGLVKHWMKGNTDASLDDSFNTSSGTDNAQGQFTYTFTNNMNNANYSIQYTCHSAGIVETNTDNQTTSSHKFQIFSRPGLSSFADVEHLGLVAGDLA